MPHTQVHASASCRHGLDAFSPVRQKNSKRKKQTLEQSLEDGWLSPPYPATSSSAWHPAEDVHKNVLCMDWGALKLGNPKPPIEMGKLATRLSAVERCRQMGYCCT